MDKGILSLPLAVTAEIIRKEIKAIIPKDSEEGKPGKAERLPTRIKGSVMYGGDNLARKVSELIKEMKIGKVRNFTRLFFFAHTNIVDLDYGAFPRSEGNPQRLPNVSYSAIRPLNTFPKDRRRSHAPTGIRRGALCIHQNQSYTLRGSEYHLHHSPNMMQLLLVILGADYSLCMCVPLGVGFISITR